MRGNYKKCLAKFREQAVMMVIETSRPIAQVARELGVVEGTLGNWVNAYRREHASDEPPLALGERARLREAERQLLGTQNGKRVPKKAAAYFAQIHP